MRRSISDLPGTLPKATIPDDIQTAEILAESIRRLPSLCQDDLKDDALWRDSFALTGTSRTFFGADCLTKAWSETSSSKGPTKFALTPHTARISRHGEYAWIEALFTFQTTKGVPQMLGSGQISLVPSSGPDGRWKIWLLTTVLENFCGEKDVDVLEAGVPKPLNVDNPSHFDVVVLGGGQSGLAVGGRLHALGVPYVVIDRNDQVGDSWMSRYDSVKLHTLREHAHLPFERTFDTTYPEWLTKYDLGRAYQTWVDKYNINVWTSTNLLSCVRQGDSWIVRVSRNGTEQSVMAKHVVLAIGTAQKPRMPEYANKDVFKGIVLHSSEYKSSSQWKGKKGVVVGTANTGHDIAEDMLQAGLESVTMIQRNKTFVLPQKNASKMQGLLYNSHIPTDLADRILFSSPMSISRQVAMFHLHEMANEQSDFFDALEAAGFKTERYGDLISALYERLGGHYMNVGASEKIAKGLIKVHSTSQPEAFTPEGLQLQDGGQIPADVIVFATGFDGNMRNAVGNFVESEVYEKLSEFWGVDEEGELLGAFKFTGYPGIWYTGGDLAMGRYFSRFVALQIKADLLGTPLERYEKKFPPS